jgi:hypothetical protein
MASVKKKDVEEGETLTDLEEEGEEGEGRGVVRALT